MLPQKKIKIALTGGIGTGKTYISKHFFDIGIPVFYADDEAKILYFSEKVLNFVKKEYGNSLIINNQLDIFQFSKLVFSKIEIRKQIEALIHPMVIQQFDKWVSQQTSNIVLLESAIIFEAGLEKLFDKIIVVDAPLAIRIKRIKDRNPELSESEILQRMDSQMPQAEKCKRADWVIWNG
jgi:dephospho-CoA kinase